MSRLWVNVIISILCGYCKIGYRMTILSKNRYILDCVLYIVGTYRIHLYGAWDISY